MISQLLEYALEKMQIYRNVPLKGYTNRTLWYSFSNLEDKYNYEMQTPPLSM